MRKYEKREQSYPSDLTDAHCSHKQIGKSIPRTAAAQGEYCVNNGLTIAKSQLQPGDLIFFSHKANGRYLNITHVAVYAGMKDGKLMVVDASSSRGKVVYRELYSGAVLYGHILTN